LLDGERSVQKSKLGKDNASTAKDLVSRAPTIISAEESNLDPKTEK